MSTLLDMLCKMFDNIPRWYNHQNCMWHDGTTFDTSSSCIASIGRSQGDICLCIIIWMRDYRFVLKPKENIQCINMRFWVLLTHALFWNLDTYIFDLYMGSFTVIQLIFNKHLITFNVWLSWNRYSRFCNLIFHQCTNTYLCFKFYIQNTYCASSVLSCLKQKLTLC